MRDPSKSLNTKLVRIWNWLTEPSALVREPDQKRQARLLAILFLMLLPVGLLRAVLPVIIEPSRGAAWQPLEFRVIALMSFFVFFAYGLTRTRFYSIAAVGIIVLSSIAIFAAMIPLGSTTKFAGFYYLILPVLFASIFFSARLAFVVALVDLAGITFVPLFSPAVPVDDLYLGPFSFVAIMSLVVLLMTYYRNRVEQDRQAELSASEARYRSLVENAPIAIYTTLVAGDQVVIGSLSPGFEKMTGWSARDWIGKSFTALVHPDDLPRAQASFQRAMQGEIVPAYELRIRARAGEYLFGEFVSTPYVRGDQIVGELGVARDITKRKRAEEDARRRAMQLESLRQIGLELTAELHLDALFQSILQRAVELTDANGGGLYVYDPARDVIVRRVGVGQVMMPVGTTRVRGESLAGKIFATGKSLAVEDYAQVDAPDAVPVSGAPTPVMGAPIFWGDEFLGVVTVGRHTPRAFQRGDIELLEMVASYAATALRNARALEAEERARRAAEALTRSTAIFANLGQGLNATTNPTQAAEIITDAADQLLGWDACFFSLYSAERDEFHILHQVDVVNDLRTVVTDEHVMPPTPAFRRILREGAWLLNRDAPDPGVPMQRFGDTTRRSESLMFVPIRNGAQVYGVLSIQSYTPRAYNQESLNLLQSLAEHCGGALERLRVTEQIRASLAEKEILLKEVHHRVKNNLQIVSSLLSLQSAQVKDAPTREIFRDSQNRIRSMALVHERLYRAADLARVDLGEYARGLAAHILRSYGAVTERIGLNVAADTVLVGVDLAISCGLILNELISNAVKHAFPDGRRGVIHIEVRALSERARMVRVRDDGVGLPEDLDFRNTASLGLQLVNTLAQQINGTVEVAGQVGTNVTIRFNEPA